MSINFKANIIFRGKIECLTGLHIGGSKDKLEIGGVDSPVLRDPFTRQPYIPGSSIKGRLRALLEYGLNVVNNEKDNEGKPSEDPKIVSLFGTSADDNEPNDVEHKGPTPLIVRDCQADAATVEMWDNLDSELLFTEYKAENTINRITSAANPRFLERVVAGSVFDFEMVYTVMDYGENYLETVNENLKHLFYGMRMVEDNSLGKSGSRGYGKVRFKLVEPIIVRKKDYQENTENYKASKVELDPEKLKTLFELDQFSYTEA